MYCSLPGSSIHGILQARILKWVAISFSRGSSQARDQTWVSCIVGNLRHYRQILYQLSSQGIHDIIYIWLCLVIQSCLIHCDPVDCSLPGSSVHGIFQARVLEWVVISFSRGSSRSRDQARVSRIGGRCYITSEPPGKFKSFPHVKD